HIVEQIHALIREGRWVPGDQIPPERELAERFRVSRTSVREALRALEMQGIIDSRQGGGTFVRTADTEALVPPLAAAILRGRRELAEVLEVRELIEPGIARLAATRATAEHAYETGFCAPSRLTQYRLGEVRCALLFEGGDALGEVGVAGGDGLIVGFQLEHALE